jgi:hypothetical protein
MKTEDILSYEAELRAIRETLATYVVVFDFAGAGTGEALSVSQRVLPDAELTGSAHGKAREAGRRPEAVA